MAACAVMPLPTSDTPMRITIIIVMPAFSRP
jgi:hypothetical protein